MQEIYLDNNATTKPLPEVTEAVTQALSTNYGNPSSPHSRGLIARQSLLEARNQVAALVGAEHIELLFTSGGTEANNMVLQGLCADINNSSLVTTAVEHSSVLHTACNLEGKGLSVKILEVDHYGRVNPDSLEQVLGGLSPFQRHVVSIQWANSETGTIQPIDILGEICKKHNAIFHVDAAQAVGRIPINMQHLTMDYLTFTAHKIHGPQGIGALVMNELPSPHPLLTKIMHGGEQELGLRAGTENLPGIMGFARAAKIRMENFAECNKKLRNLRDKFESLIVASLPQAKVNSDVENRVVNSTNILFPGSDGMAMMAQLDGAGICCSLTSACISSRPEPSHVLRAMGLSEADAYSSLRFSFSVLNTEEEATKAANKVGEIYKKLAGVSQSERVQT